MSAQDTATRKRLTREERREQTRRHLIEAAGEVIVAHGFEGASIDAITEAAGYTRGAFYSNFSSKEELFVELCDHKLGEFAEEVVPAIRAAAPADKAAVAARLLTEGSPRPEAMLLLELARLRMTNDEVGELMEGFEESFTAMIAGMITEFGDDLVDAEPDLIEDAARTLVAAIIGIVFLGHVGFGDQAMAERLLTGAVIATFSPPSNTDG